MTGKRTDNNHAEIREALRMAGAVVLDCTPWQGAGFDLLVAYSGDLRALEVKQPGKRAALTPTETKRILEFGSQKVSIHIVTNITEALGAIGAPIYRVREAL